MGKLVILAGPSCVGKSPLDKALKKFYPELRNALQHLVLYISRSPRPGETDGVDYHFRTREAIDQLRKNEHFVVMEVRGDLQALDIKQVKEQLAHGDVFFEGNPFIGRTLLTHEALADVEKLSAFLSPLSREELLELNDPGNHADAKKIVTEIMQRKLMRRTRKQKGELSLSDLQNIETRAGSAYQELQGAHQFHYIIPNHDGEDSENWDAFYYPLGDARKSLRAFAELLKGNIPEVAEVWHANMF